MGESGFVLNLPLLDIRKIKSRKPPEGTQTPLEAHIGTFWKLLLMTPSRRSKVMLLDELTSAVKR
jgi:hypothetical protein